MQQCKDDVERDLGATCAHLVLEKGRPGVGTILDL